MSQILIAGLTIVFLCWYLKFQWQRRKLYWAASKLPGPMWLPIIGNALSCVGSGEDILKTLMQITKNYEKPVPVWGGYKLYFIIKRAEDIDVILNSPLAIEKDDSYNYSWPVLGSNLMSSPAKIWKVHRKMISPTFNQKILDTFVDIFAVQSQILVGCLKEDDGKICDLHDRMARMAVDTICESAMGIKLNHQKSDSSYASNIERALEIIFMRMRKVWYQSDTIFRMTSYYNEQNRILKEMVVVTNGVIQEKKRDFAQRLKDKQENVFVGDANERRKAFLDLLIELPGEGSKFTDQDLHDETTAMIAAGSDSSATMNSFTMTCLGLHPDIQQKVYQEVIDVVGPDRSVCKDDLQHLKYLERVIKEVMRVFPIGPVISRRITGDIELKDKVILPEGSSLLISIYSSHFDEKHWPDPWKFDPDRFLPEVTARRHPYAYLPFSAGPRNCIGMKYAMMAMKVTIATVVRQYHVFTDYKSIKDVRVKLDLIIKPVDGYKVRVKSRQ